MRIIPPTTTPCRWEPLWYKSPSDTLCQARVTGMVRKCSLTVQRKRLPIFNFSQAVWICAIIDGTHVHVKNLTHSLSLKRTLGPQGCVLLCPWGQFLGMELLVVDMCSGENIPQVHHPLAC